MYNEVLAMEYVCHPGSNHATYLGLHDFSQASDKLSIPLG
jgi:hypothetical protein